MLNWISRLGETRLEQEWLNGTEFSGYSDFPEKRLYSKGAFHSTKISGLTFRNFHTSNGTVFSTSPDRSRSIPA